MIPKNYLIDMDGTLTKNIAWTPKDCLRAKPRKDMIKAVNKLFETDFIIIYTARRDNLIPNTLEWLRRNNVRYHAISNLKLPAFAYVDDKMLSIKEFLGGKK